MRTLVLLVAAIMILMLTAAQGKRPLNHKFTDDMIRYIREQAKTRTYQDIANEHNVTKQCIFRIVKRLNYSDVA